MSNFSIVSWVVMTMFLNIYMYHPFIYIIRYLTTNFLFRFQTYYNQTMPIIDHYSREGLVKRISAVLPPDEVMFSALFQALSIPD